MATTTPQQPLPLILALCPIICLVVLLAAAVYLFGDSAASGPSQIALLISASVAMFIGYCRGITWDELERSLVHGISLAMKAILILLMVGALIGHWIAAGTVPTLIAYGLELLNPSYFYFASCLLCAVIALSIGSSWTVAGTVGVALIGVAIGMQLSPAVTAGAIISGAYFGDKLSPLSETTNLAPAVAGGELFSHIRHMLWTTVPSLILALLLFAFLGASAQGADISAIKDLQQQLQQQFIISVWCLLPLSVLLVLAIKKMPALPALFIATVLAACLALLVQQQDLISLWQISFAGFELKSDNATLNDLLSRGGMSSMLTTIWLIMSAMVFGAAIEKVGVLQRLLSAALAWVKGTSSLLVTTLLTCIGVNIIAADQYIAIVLPGRMYQLEFERRGLAWQNLSRCLEDAGTITSPLVPWNSCGAYMAATLGVATLAYLPFCFFNLINLLLAFLYVIFNFKIAKAA